MGTVVVVLVLVEVVLVLVLVGGAGPTQTLSKMIHMLALEKDTMMFIFTP